MLPMTMSPSAAAFPSARARTGKIARLPQNLREELNRRLADGEEGNSLLAWLNALPEAQAVLAEHFGGRPITHSNLSDWRLGGWADWRLRQDAFALAGPLLKEEDDPARPDPDRSLMDRFAPLAALSIGTLLRSFPLTGLAHDPDRTRAVLAGVRTFTRLRVAELTARRAVVEQARSAGLGTAFPGQGQSR
jgi:hypothetical protein